MSFQNTQYTLCILEGKSYRKVYYPSWNRIHFNHPIQIIAYQVTCAMDLNSIFKTNIIPKCNYISYNTPRLTESVSKLGLLNCWTHNLCCTAHMKRYVTVDFYFLHYPDFSLLCYCSYGVWTLFFIWYLLDNSSMYSPLHSG